MRRAERLVAAAVLLALALHMPDAPNRPGRKGEVLSYGYIELNDEREDG